MKAQWIILIVLGGLLVLGLAAYLAFRKGPDLSSYLPLKEPRLTRKEDERVLEVEFSGPADTIIPKAYSVLFKAYYGAKGSPKGPAMKPPKARYAALADFGLDARSVAELKAHDWSGAVAIPIPEGLALPDTKPEAEQVAAPLVAKTAVWEYGDVAEILHLGSYETEPPTIKKLLDFIAAQGYAIVGDHEEEYLKGPGMFGVSPKDYWTIVRYRVRKAR